MAVATRAQVLQSLRAQRVSAFNLRQQLRQEALSRQRKDLGGIGHVIRRSNLQNTRLQALDRLIILHNQGFSFSPRQIADFIRARVSGDVARISFERGQRRAVDRLVRSEKVSRAVAFKSIKVAKARLRKILGNRPSESLTLRDAERLSSRDRAALNIRISPRRPTPAPTKKQTEGKPPGIVFATPQPEGKGLGKTVAQIREEVGILQTKDLRGDITPKEKQALKVASLALVTAQTGLAAETILRNPKKFVKEFPALLAAFPSLFKKEAVTFGEIARTSPSRATGIVAGTIFTFIGTAKAISALEKGGTKVLGKAIAKDIETTPVGTKIIRNVKGVGDIEIIPKGKVPKLEVDPLRAVKEAQLKKQLRTTPKIPKTSQIEKDILSVVKKRGDAVTGSFAQQTLLKKTFARKFKDIDIVTINQQALKKAIKRKLKGRVRFTTLRIKDKKTGKRITVIRVFDTRTNKLIADLDPITLAEEGFIKRFGITSHKGLRIVRPEARLAAKVKQLEKITKKTPRKKIKKITKDIAALTGGRLRAEVRGGFGFSKKELGHFVGKVGPITTAQINLLGKGIFKSSQLKVKRWLFASPFNPKTGRAQFRVSRLGINKQNEARLLDLLGLGDEISFRKSKPQIFIFPKEKIFAPSKKIKRGITTKTPSGFVVPKFSSELEVVLGKGFILKRGKTLSRVNIEGRIVPIIELKKIRISNTAKRLLSERSRTLKRLIKGKLSTTQKRSLTNKLKRESVRLNRQLKRETGLDYNLRVSPRPKRVRVFDVKSKGLSALARRRRRISRGISIAPVSRRKALPPSRPSSIIKRPPKSPPKSPPVSPAKSPPKSLPVSPPKILPRLPPRGLPKGFPFGRKKRRRIRLRKEIVSGFNVEGKSKGKWIKLNRVPLQKQDAHSRGAWAIDHSTARTYRIRAAGKPKKLGSVTSKERGYFARKKQKFRDFRIVKGLKKKLVNKRIEKTKHAIDTRGEKRQLSLARLIKREGFVKARPRRTVRQKPIKRAPTRRRIINRGIFG